MNPAAFRMIYPLSQRTKRAKNFVFLTISGFSTLFDLSIMSGFSTLSDLSTMSGFSTLSGSSTISGCSLYFDPSFLSLPASSSSPTPRTATYVSRPLKSHPDRDEGGLTSRTRVRSHSSSSSC